MRRRSDGSWNVRSVRRRRPTSWNVSDGQVRLEGFAQGVGELGAGHLACNAVIV